MGAGETYLEKGLTLGGGNEGVDDDLRAIEKSTELRLPDGEQVGALPAHPHLETGKIKACVSVPFDCAAVHAANVPRGRQTRSANLADEPISDRESTGKRVVRRTVRELESALRLELSLRGTTTPRSSGRPTSVAGKRSQQAALRTGNPARCAPLAERPASDVLAP